MRRLRDMMRRKEFEAAFRRRRRWTIAGIDSDGLQFKRNRDDGPIRRIGPSRARLLPPSQPCSPRSLTLPDADRTVGAISKVLYFHRSKCYRIS